METTHTPWRRPDPLPGFLETERLVLRWWQADDAAALNEAVASDRAALLPWLPWAATTHKTVEDSATTIAWFDAMREKGEDYTIGAFDKVTGEAIGGTGFHRLQPDAHEAETGYWVRGSRQGEGLATEMTRAMVSIGFTAQADGGWGLRRIHLRCMGDNRASQRVIEKLHIPLEGRERESRWLDGAGYQDFLIYGVLSHEWDLAASGMRSTP